MLMDNTLVFSDGQKITATAASTNKVDQLAAGDAFAALWLVVDVKEAFTNLTSLTIGIETDDVAAFTGAKELAAVKVAKADRNEYRIKQSTRVDKTIRVLFV